MNSYSENTVLKKLEKPCEDVRFWCDYSDFFFFAL